MSHITVKGKPFIRVNTVTNSTTVCCVGCNKIHRLDATVEQIRRWCNGEPAQRAFPQLHAAERELMISGTCNDCWSAMFGRRQLSKKESN